jgi:stress response protein YsnF
VTGGSRVVFAEDAQATEQPEPQGRSISEEEIAQSGLLQERVIEIGEMREEAVVSKQAVVREELVVRRDVEQRTERISDTLRRTEVDIERLEPAGTGRKRRTRRPAEADRQDETSRPPRGREPKRVGKH